MSNLQLESGMVLGALLISLCACGGGAEQVASTSFTSEVRGTVIEVKASSVLELISLDVEDDRGRMWHFLGGEFRGFTPAHLREHMMQGLPVTVKYREENTVFVIDEITD